MKRLLLSAFLVYLASISFASEVIRIRLFASDNSSYAVFSVVSGRYEVDTYNGSPIAVEKDFPLFVSKYNGHIILKHGNLPSFICDSLCVCGKTGNDLFSLRVSSGSKSRHTYAGDLQCLPDMGTLLLINITDMETYIAGVVKAEGGSGRNTEYFKTQAILARTYMYKYIGKHTIDRFNLCDETHCQAYDGITGDSVIIDAARETAGLVILAPDSTLIISAFHSNCGGETSPAEYAWVINQPYLRGVSDPWCHSSRNALWTMKMPYATWAGYLSKSGFRDDPANHSIVNFTQNSRANYYKAGDFSIPFRQIRSDLNLRSAFFSVTAVGDTVTLSGRGYGHGVGLCQEGAMVMASRGFTFMQIIDFYFKGVMIEDIKDALLIDPNQ